MYAKPDLCAKCGGICCKRAPGIFHPIEDFQGDHKKIKKAVLSGLATIDWWEGSPEEQFTGVCGYPENDFCREESLRIRCTKGFYLRPPVKGKEHRRCDPSWGGAPCSFLTPTGCVLLEKDRPHECRMLEPSEPECKYHGSEKQELAIAWKPWWPILQELMHY